MQPRALMVSPRSVARANRPWSEPRRERWWVTGVLLVPIVLLLVVSLAGCGRGMAQATAVPGGDVRRGERALATYGCGACHTIAGVTGAHGKVGPPLDGVAERSFIAGEAPNTPENLVHWIRDPQAIEPNTAMPNLGVDERSARDMTAYLYTLR
jgi:cytochrome c2